AADRGTLFLDEIGEADPSVQARLLKVLEGKRIRRVGSVEEIPVDFRLVSATNRDLAADGKAGRFRQDLFWRISVLVVELPPLRRRSEDVPLLAERMLESLPRRSGRRTFAPDALAALSAHTWPGNV